MEMHMVHLNLIAVGGELWLLGKRYETETERNGIKSSVSF